MQNRVSIPELRARADAGDADAMNELGYRHLHGMEVERDEVRAVELFRWAAHAGHLVAMNDLARCLLEGIGVARDVVEAIRTLTEAAHGGLVIAQLNLAHCYRDRIGVSRDEHQVRYWLARAAEGGHPAARCELGRLAERDGDVLVAFEQYMQAARANAAEGQFEVGRCLQEGIGVTAELQLGMHYLRLAAAQSFTDAEYRIGLCYEFGTGAEKNANEAALWYRRAVDGGHSLALAQFEQLQLRTLSKLGG